LLEIIKRKEEIQQKESIKNVEIIGLKNLKKIYNFKGDKETSSQEIRALDGVDISIHQGEYVAIIGPSGSGKSTLMQILGLLDRSTSGEHSFLGHELKHLTDDQITLLRSQNIGFVFQFYNLLARTSALENVELPLVYAQIKKRKQMAQGQLEKLNLEGRLYHQPHQLSGGQQQRVAIARALVNNPSLILADEPTGNVNTTQANEIMEDLDQLNKQGKTIIVVTHDPEVASHAHRVIHLRDGKITSDEMTKEKTSHQELEEYKKPDLTVLPLLNLGLLWENLKISFRALRVNILRSFLTMLGVIIGVGAVITMVAIGEGAKKTIEDQLKSLGSNVLMIRPGSRKFRHVRSAGQLAKLTREDAQALKELKKTGVPIIELSEEVYGSVQVVHSNKNWNTRLMGVTPNYVKIRVSPPQAGRFFTEEENISKQKVCLLGKTVYENLFPEGQNPIGLTIKINRVNFKVIGILPTKGASYWRDQDDIVAIPLLTAMGRVLGKTNLASINVQIEYPEAIYSVIKAMKKVLRKRHKLGKEKEDDFSIMNMTEIRNVLAKTTKTMGLLLGAIAGISLIVGGIGIMNIMLVTVKERTREIGLRKALGARNVDVLFQFLMEAIVICLLGGCIGIIVAGAVSWGVGSAFDWPIGLSLNAILMAFFSSFTVGVVFGLWPARQASLLSPIESLRYE
jgi:macrolide transport system ATP-binding/permease protein